MMVSILTATLILAASWLLYCFYYVWWRFFSHQGIPRHIPWAGSDGTWLSRGRSSRQSVFGLRDLLWDGYQRVRGITPTLHDDHEVLTPVIALQGRQPLCPPQHCDRP